MSLQAELSPATTVEEITEALHGLVKPARRATSTPPRWLHDIAGLEATYVTHTVGGYACERSRSE